MDRVRLPLEAHPGRKDWAGLKVNVRRHLDGSHSVCHGIRLLGRFDTHGNKKITMETPPRAPNPADSIPSPRRPSVPAGDRGEEEGKRRERAKNLNAKFILDGTRGSNAEPLYYEHLG